MIGSRHRQRRSLVPAVGLCLVLLAAACGDDGSNGASASTTATTVPPPVGSTVVSDDGELRATVLFQGEGPDELPMAAVTRPDGGDTYVAMRTGQIWRSGDPTLEDRELALDLSDEVAGTDGEQALLDLAFSPDGRWLYVSLTARDDAAASVPTTGPDLTPDDAAYVVAAYAMDGDEVDQSSRVELLRVPEMGRVHSGGEVEFGPDGMLYLTTGDSNELQADVAQDRLDWRGKVLRLDPSGPEPSLGVPDDNPFVDDPESRPEVWAYGLRNPWGLTFDPATGDLWLPDVGENLFEEVNHIAAPDTAAGANFGWRIREGNGFPFADRLPLPDDYREPQFVYPHEDGRCAIVGGVVYRGTDLPDLVGDYLFTDFCDPRLRALTVTDEGEYVERDLGLEFPDASPSSFDVTPDGEVLFLDVGGRIYQLGPADG